MGCYGDNAHYCTSFEFWTISVYIDILVANINRRLLRKFEKKVFYKDSKLVAKVFLWVAMVMMLSIAHHLNIGPSVFITMNWLLR